MPKTPERFSSLHDDIQIPWITHVQGLGEYIDISMQRFDPKDRSVLTRLSQFGVDLSLLEEQGAQLSDLTIEQYRALIREALKQKYDIIFGSVIDKFVMSGFGSGASGLERMKNVIQMADEYQQWGINIVNTGKDVKPDQANLVIALEGADFVAELEDIKKLVEAGIRVFGLQYNKDNQVATNKGGLTPLGIKAVKYLLQQNKGIDLAHSSRKTRADVMDLAKDQDKGSLISYTHGSTTQDVPSDMQARLKASERFLEPVEFQQIIKLGGIIGLGVTRPFFGSITAMAERIDQTCQLENGINHLAIGSDFGGVWNDLTFGIKSIDDLSKLADTLSVRFGMSDEDIRKVLRTNARHWVQKALSR
jgi:microsomal dipeptidase-like Zn-dependent dipeptidase